MRKEAGLISARPVSEWKSRPFVEVFCVPGDRDLARFGGVGVLPVGANLRLEHPAVGKNELFHFTRLHRHGTDLPYTHSIAYYTYYVNTYNVKQERRGAFFLLSAGAERTPSEPRKAEKVGAFEN